MALEMPNRTQAAVPVPQNTLRNSVEVIFKALWMQQAKPPMFQHIQQIQEVAVAEIQDNYSIYPVLDLRYLYFHC